MATEPGAKLTEAVADVAENVAEEALEFADAARTMRGIQVRYVLLGTAAAAATGAVVGYYVAYRRLETKYERIAEAEIDEMRDHFRKRLVAKEAKPNLNQMVKKTEDLGYTTVEPPPPGSPNTPPSKEELEVAKHNIFEQKVDPADGWNYELELASRSKERPYVIHIDERGETDFDEITLTYYAGDDVLCNSDDSIMDNQERIVGTRNLDRFGHGSGDKSIVYIRNEELNLDIEVVRSDKTYAEEVHGFKHEDPPRKRRTPRDE